jgi:hypothetical protein
VRVGSGGALGGRASRRWVRVGCGGALGGGASRRRVRVGRGSALGGRASRRRVRVGRGGALGGGAAGGAGLGALLIIECKWRVSNLVQVASDWCSVAETVIWSESEALVLRASHRARLESRRGCVVESCSRSLIVIAMRATDRGRLDSVA